MAHDGDNRRARLEVGLGVVIDNRVLLFRRNDANFATHIVSDIEAISDSILLMKEGKLLCSGTARELIASLPEDWKPVLHAPSLEDVYLYYLGEERHE